jgi:cytochrome c
MEVEMNHIMGVAIIVLLLAASPFRAMSEPGNAANGERMYRACAACHSLEPDKNMTGPSLADIWNRKKHKKALTRRDNALLGLSCAAKERSATAGCGDVEKQSCLRRYK